MVVKRSLKYLERLNPLKQLRITRKILITEKRKRKRKRNVTTFDGVKKD